MYVTEWLISLLKCSTRWSRLQSVKCRKINWCFKGINYIHFHPTAVWLQGVLRKNWPLVEFIFALEVLPPICMPLPTSEVTIYIHVYPDTFDICNGYVCGGITNWRHHIIRKLVSKYAVSPISLSFNRKAHFANIHTVNNVSKMVEKRDSFAP